MLWSSLGRLVHDRRSENEKARSPSRARSCGLTVDPDQSEGQNGDCWWRPVIQGHSVMTGTDQYAPHASEDIV